METPLLQIRLLGGVDLRSGDSLPLLESARAESLLAYLLLHRHAPQSRQRLAFLLWPDSTEHQARTNLRHLLHTLRRALPDADSYLETTLRTLQWRPDMPFSLDVADFEAEISQAGQADDGGLAALRKAVALYRGDLLEGCYDDWILPERERLRAQYLAALARLIPLLEAQGDIAEAISVAEQLQRQDPLREETYRLLMRLHNARGDRARALHVYHVCVATLERELGVEPAPATREAYEALLPVDEQPAAGAEQSARLGGPPLVGRAAEWSRLVELWRGIEEGRAHLVLITGEPGIGKTRLVEEFRSWGVRRGAVAAEARSYAAEGAVAYGAVVAWLRSEELSPRLRRIDRPGMTELARLLPDLLTTVPGLARPDPLPADDQRRRVFDAVARVLCAPGLPLLLVADDLQWCDRETLQFLHYLLRTAGDAHLLVVGTARREETDPRHPLNDLLVGLRALDRCTEIELGRLSPAETATVAEWMAGHPVADPEAKRLYGETEGNPLFVVEALRAGWERDTSADQWISPRVQAAIETRLTQLTTPVRSLVDLAAAIGREFTTDVLADASGVDEETLVQALDDLWRRRIIREQGPAGYDFSHDKIREAAYRSLSPARRRQAHARVARALEGRHAPEPGPIAGQIAAHFEQAGAIPEAVTWYERAAAEAQRLHSNVEAIRLLERALELLHALPETAERHERELVILAAMPPSLGWVEGWASERLATVHQRSLDLAGVLGAELSPLLLRSMAIASLSRRDFVAACERGEQLRARGVRDADDMLLVEAGYVLGVAAFWQGEFEAARGHFQAAVERYRPEHRHAHIVRYGLDPKVICQSRLGNTLWFLGRPNAAMRASEQALALAGEIGHQYSREVALVFAALLALELRDAERFRSCAAMLGTGPPEEMSRPTQFSGEAIAGYTEILDGRIASGLARIRATIDESSGVDHAPGMHAALERLMLEACVRSGDARSGLVVADRALASMGPDHLWEAEIRRLRAEFLAALGASADEAEAELDRALIVARRQGARMLELRIAATILRHRLRNGDRPGACSIRDLLMSLIQELPEARDSDEVREAATLIAQS